MGICDLYVTSGRQRMDNESVWILAETGNWNIA